MNEEDARHLLLVRAIESEDTAQALLTHEDRQRANAAGLAASGGGGLADERFLAGRATFAFGRLKTRFPAVERASRAATWPAWLDWLLPLAALITGVLANELDGGRRLNLIAFPLIGMLLWNVAVYTLLVAGAIRGIMPGRHDSARTGAAARLFERIGALAHGTIDRQQPLGRALAAFASDWSRHARALTLHRASRTLHFSAAALAAGVLLGMYLRALGIEYRAGWESTFISTGTLHRALALVLGPASALTGILLPSADHLAALRWSTGDGENAGAWIHLFAITAALVVIIPRLLLAFWSLTAAALIRRRFPIPGREDFYIRRLLRGLRGSAAEVRVVPYSFNLPEPVRRVLQRVSAQVLGDDMRMIFDTPIAYGAEDEWLERIDLGDAIDHIVLLFNLSATPEVETHGAAVAGLKRLLAERRSGASMTVLLEESAYRQRLGQQHGTAVRIEERRLAWERVLDQQDVKPLSVDLEAASEPDLVRRFEGGLLPSATLDARGTA